MSEQYYHDPYSCSYNAGRWNPKGIRMVYAGSAPSVSLLEYLCIKGNAVGRHQWYMIAYDIVAGKWIGEIDKAALPPDWNIVPHGKSTQEFGRTWLQEKAFPFLKVPSARINLAFYPEEHNLLINPDFPGLRNLLTLKETIPFGYLLG